MRWPRQRRARFIARTNGAAADGEIVWSWSPDAEAKFAGVTNAADDGCKQARSPGRVRISRKAIAQGMPDDLAEPVVPSPCFFHCTGAMGEAFTRHSLRPLVFRRAGLSQSPGEIAPRDC